MIRIKQRVAWIAAAFVIVTIVTTPIWTLAAHVVAG